MAREFTCNDCGASGATWFMSNHDCQANQDVAAFGGRCEDFPCCGHQAGECSDRPEFHKEYWNEVFSGMDDGEIADMEYRMEGAY